MCEELFNKDLPPINQAHLDSEGDSMIRYVIANIQSFH